MIIMDDDFATIVNGVEEGRLIIVSGDTSLGKYGEMCLLAGQPGEVHCLHADQQHPQDPPLLGKWLFWSSNLVTQLLSRPGSCSKSLLPLSTLAILAVDLFTDMVPAISFAYEKTELDIMQRPPCSPATVSSTTD